LNVVFDIVEQIRNMKIGDANRRKLGPIEPGGVGGLPSHGGPQTALQHAQSKKKMSGRDFVRRRHDDYPT